MAADQSSQRTKPGATLRRSDRPNAQLPPALPALTGPERDRSGWQAAVREVEGVRHAAVRLERYDRRLHRREEDHRAELVRAGQLDLVAAARVAHASANAALP